MQIKSCSLSGSEALLQEQFNIVDGKLDTLLEKLSLNDKKGVEDEQPTNNFSSENSDDEHTEDYDESQLTAKGRYKKENASARDAPYEIPIPVQRFQSQTVTNNVTDTKEACYPPYAELMGLSGLGMGSPNILLASRLESPQSSSQLSSAPQWVDSPQSSDSGINSPTSSPARICQPWSSEQTMQGCAVSTTVPTSVADWPCSPESGYSPSGSPEIHSQSWQCDQQSPEHGLHDESSADKVTSSSNVWSHGPFEFCDSSIGIYQYVPNIPNDWTADVLPQQNLPATAYGCRSDELTAYPNIPVHPESPVVESEDPEVQQLGQVDPGQLIDPAFLEKLIQDMLYDAHLGGPEDAVDPEPSTSQPSSQPATSSHPDSQFPTPPTPQPSKSPPQLEPKTKKTNSRNKSTEQKPQPNRRTNKKPQLDSTEPKICSIIDQSKLWTQAIWMAICRMTNEELAKKNKDGRTCLMEVLLGEKPSVERVFYIVKRMWEMGPVLSCKGEDGKNALYLAAINHPNIPQLASFIAESYAKPGLDVNESFFEEKNSLIHCLVEEGESHRDLLRELLDLKVEGRRLFDPNLRNANGDAPIHLAVRNLRKMSHPYDLSLVDILIKRGASISTQNSSGETPLHIAAKVACDEKVFRKIFERLSLPPEENQGAMNIQDIDGNTALHLVAYHINPCNVEKMKKVVQVFLSERNTLTGIKNKVETTAEQSIHQSCVKEFYDLFHKRK